MLPYPSQASGSTKGEKPDTTEQDRFRKNAVSVRGPVWEARFRTIWNDPGMTLKYLAKELDISKDAAKRYAARLMLPFPRAGGVSAHAPTPAQPRTWAPPPVDPKMLDLHKETLIAALVANPEVKIRDLRRAHYSAAESVRANDHAWWVN